MGEKGISLGRIFANKPIFFLASDEVMIHLNLVQNVLFYAISKEGLKIKVRIYLF